MWVVENFNYQTRGQHTDDQVSRIQILEDTDGDGVFDKKKTFTDKLTFTSGLALGFGGVFVGSPPNLTFIPDADGDDKPDGPPQVLLDGWGINDRHETLNSFIWGPDGWLYGCHGVFTQSRVGKAGCRRLGPAIHRWRHLALSSDAQDVRDFCPRTVEPLGLRLRRSWSGISRPAASFRICSTSFRAASITNKVVPT